VELSVALHDWTRPLGPARVALLEAMPQLLCPMDPRLMRATVDALRSRHLDVHLGSLVEEVREDGVAVRRGEARGFVAADLVIWTAGVQANPLLQQLPVEHAAGGRVRVEPTLQLPSFPEVLALGDGAACPDPEGQVLPATAQVAVQQAAAAARALQALVDGQPPRPFRYRRRGELLGLGRMGAVAEAFGVRLAGLPAWLVVSLVHLARLPDWGDRAAVAWAWAKDAFRGPGHQNPGGGAPSP
jgi:NADH dehydrogenase